MGLGLTISLMPTVLAGGRVAVDYWWTRDLYHLRLQADTLSLSAALAIYLVGLLTCLYPQGLSQPALRSPEERPSSAHRAALLLAAQGSGMGAVLSADLIALVFFLELMLVCLWLLVRQTAGGQALHTAGGQAPGAGRMLANVHLGGVLILGGALVMWQKAGNTSLHDLPLLLLSVEPPLLRLIALLLLLGFLPRIFAFPGYGWLPALLPAGRSAALISAPLVLIVGCAALLRLLPGSLLLPTIPSVAGWSLVLGLVALWWGALRAWYARELGALAVWLTVAQAGHLLLALGAAASPGAVGAALQAAALHLVFAPLAVLAAWCVSNDVAARVGSDGLAGLSGLLRTMPLTGLALLAGGLSLAGLPPLAGFQVQRLLVSALLAGGRPVLAAVVVAGDAALAAAVVNGFRQAFLRREPPPPTKPAPFWLSAQLVLLVVALLISGLWTEPSLQWSEAMMRTALSVSP
jgi:formate hydrogenlyase subunit 3/multisubunit Na+/H+ antiporter MnhD subunit